jgi:hypothetical protein
MRPEEQPFKMQPSVNICLYLLQMELFAFMELQMETLFFSVKIQISENGE